MSAICWVLWTHICLIGFIYTHTNIFINTENISNNDKHTLPHEEGEDERGGCGCRDGGVSGSLTLLILCIAAHTHAAIQLHILNLNTQDCQTWKKNRTVTEAGQIQTVLNFDREGSKHTTEPPNNHPYPTPLHLTPAPQPRPLLSWHFAVYKVMTHQNPAR